jgi:hypothetical protein
MAVVQWHHRVVIHYHIPPQALLRLFYHFISKKSIGLNETENFSVKDDSKKQVI